MKKELWKKIKIPEGIEVTIDGSVIKMNGSEGNNEKKFNTARLIFEKKENEIVIGNKVVTKKEKKQMNTIVAHIKNMFKGVTKKFEYELKIANSHFPMTVSVEGKKITIKNFLGEKKPREAKVPEGAEVKVNKDIIIVTSIDKETAGQAAASIEAATKIRLRDRRIFQDGIYITKKDGKAI